MPNILEHNKDLTTTEVTLKMPDKGSVQQMWDTIKDRVIGLRNDHVPTIQTGGWKWTSNYSHDKEVLDLIRDKARCHMFWVARQHGLEGLSAHQSYNQA